MSLILQGKKLIAKYGIPIAVVLALVGLIAIGSAVNIYLEQPTTEVTETVEERQVTTDVQTSAVVTGETELYEQGETLQGKPVYFYGATPELTLRIHTEFDGFDEATVEHRLVLRHVAERDGEVFWESQRLLAAERETVNGETTTVETTINATAVREELSGTRGEIGGVGSVSSHLELSVAYETGGVTDNLEATSPLALGSRAYWLEDAVAAEADHPRTETRQVTQPRDIQRAIRIGGFGFGMVLLAVGVAALQRREFDVEQIETEIVRNRYSEWISRGEIPTKSGKQYVSIDTLEDLVDIAIDSNKRVIYDRTYEIYCVVDSEVIYYYTEGEDTIGEWLDI